MFTKWTCTRAILKINGLTGTWNFTVNHASTKEYDTRLRSTNLYIHVFSLKISKVFISTQKNQNRKEKNGNIISKNIFFEWCVWHFRTIQWLHLIKAFRVYLKLFGVGPAVISNEWLSNVEEAGSPIQEDLWHSSFGQDLWKALGNMWSYTSLLCSRLSYIWF